MEVRSADWRDEWEASWYRERLRDPTLIDAGLVVVVDGTGFLAVPVGGQRRGGYISADDAETVPSLHDALMGRPGFPRLRVRWSTCPSTCHVVEWGEDAPDDDDTARGRFYGYSEQAIGAFVDEVTWLGL
ncbi:DUF6302 family protein [Streptomyces sp. NPDC018693]|uniref:DUF6302 family protein n=1 Tax=unclassified Streptomyces TaxID=2593676 RepID=UPI00379FAD46